MAQKKKTLPPFPTGGTNIYYSMLREWAEAMEAEVADLRKELANLDSKRETPTKPETFAKSEEG